MTTSSETLFSKILIANRGEIACRIIRTAKRLGIHSVAVYSTADANALHVQLADEAWPIGEAPSRDSYLRGDKIIEVALASGVQAIHPGYGFLSENTEFAEACAKAGICFIGPPASAIRAMGSKTVAKQLMEKAKVPLIPGYHGDDQDVNTLQKAADKITYPVLIKAAAGGGGKGMRVVNSAQEFSNALSAAKREALSSFGDDTVLIEKYLSEPRHVEIQLFADKHGHVVHLFERDCSLQRRHQKVIEEAPAPKLKATVRKKMGAAAIAAAKAIHYEGAGTVEFLLDKNDDFYFMEMNTRLQVEHPVTEMITQQDLVEWQLRVACGQALPLTQDKIPCVGHAFEARIYAEDPAHDFLPMTGQLRILKTPEENTHVRVDSGITQGDSISPYYDPMLAKLIVWDNDRSTALLRLHHALSEYQAIGVTTNLAFLEKLTAHPDFIAEKIETGFIEKHLSELIPDTSSLPVEIIAIASVFVLLAERQAAQFSAQKSFDPYSPWQQHDSWRNNLNPAQTLHFFNKGEPVTVVATYTEDGYLLKIPGHAEFSVQGKLLSTDRLSIHLAEQVLQAIIIADREQLYITANGARYTLQHRMHTLSSNAADTPNHVRSPMPGTVIALLVDANVPVKRGQGLLIVEAMKMEHTVLAPADGLVKSFHFKPGDLVSEGDELAFFEVSDLPTQE